jgi:preprotein translocase SecE subunit
MNHQRYVLLAFVVGSVFAAAVLQAAVGSLFIYLDMQDVRLMGGLVNTSDLVALAGGFVAFFALLRNASAVQFTDEVVGELLKVTWPTREEALQAASTVIFTALFVSVVIGFYDLMWNNVASAFLYTSGDELSTTADDGSTGSKP